MWRRLMLSVLLCVLSMFMLFGKPFSFESSSKEIQDFVVYGMTNCIRGASLAVMHGRSDENKHDVVQLMFLTPEPILDVRRLRPRGDGPLSKKIGEDPRNLTADELMRKLGIEQVFSNRVFRMNAGCVFQVDYPVPELDWRGWGSKEEWDVCQMNYLWSCRHGRMLMARSTGGTSGCGQIALNSSLRG